jgi:predicted DNA-binding transcriptional regulator AlpA
MRILHGHAMLGLVEYSEPVGVSEIAELLGVSSNTVTSWRQRGQLPEPRWMLKSGPIWLAHDITEWYERVKGSPNVSVPPDRIAEALNLADEPARAEVYAHYGLAMGMAQMVEHELATVLVLLGQEPYQREVFLREIEDGNRKTLGQLKDQLMKKGTPVLGITHLQRVVKTRNLLAHHFFREAERSVKMNTDKGRSELIAELDEATRELFLTSQHLRSTQVRLAIKRGLSKHSVIQRIVELRSGAAPDTALGRRASTLAKGSPQAFEVIEEAFAKVETQGT